MSAASRILLAAAVLVAAQPRARAEVAELEGPDEVQALRLADANGDGLTDVLTLKGRTLWIHTGRAEALPPREARWRVELPEEVTFVDVAPPAGREAPPALLLLGRGGLYRLPLEGAEAPSLVSADGALGWASAAKAAFADFARPNGSILLPSATGWRLLGASGGVWDLDVPRDLSVRPPGAFLEDTCLVEDAYPRIWRARDGPRADTVWALAGTRLLAFRGPHVTRYDTSFLPPTGTRLLADFDGDGAPEIVHSEGSNREGTYAFYRTPPPGTDEEGRPAAEGPDLSTPAAVLRLTGFRLTPDYVDVDGDGFLDFVVTTIPIDARNTLRALGGQVTAGTKVFLNRDRGPGGTFFHPSPEASVTSDIEVTIRFSQAGNIEIQRSFTILVTGDYDGDGRKDLVIRTAPTRMRLRRGVAGGVWEEEGREFPIPPMGTSPDVEGYVADFDGDGTDEILLHYLRGPEGRDRLWVIRP